jgi:2-iminobutanoate/2-iminopropanoate deaminase
MVAGFKSERRPASNRYARPDYVGIRKLCLEAAGTSFDGVLKCHVYCVPGEGRFQAFNEVYGRYFPDTSPARVFMHVPSWPGPFDIEIDCVAVR